MADVKISQLPAATTPLAGTEEIPLVQSGTTKKATAAQIAAAAGAVTSVTASAPLASSGGTTPDISLTGTVPVANGGTGATDAATARSNLGAAASGVNSDITSLTAITGGISTADFVQFDTGITPTTAVGKLQWDPTWGGPQIGMVGGNVNLQIGQETVVYVYNNTGSTISEGQVVRVLGSQGQRLTVALAQASNDANSVTILGMATENIANGTSGFVTTQGIVNNVNTSGFADGDVAWLSATVAGGITKTKPVAPNHLVLIGYVVKGGSSGAGSIYIHTQNGYELDELHDVNITSLTNGQLLQYDSAGPYWKNVSTISGSLVTGNISGNAANVTDIVAVANGGNGTATPALTAGTNVTITGTWPNYTIAASGGSGGGDVSGPASSTDNAVVRFDGTTGKLVQNSGMLVNDAGEVNVGVWKGTEVGISYGGTGASSASQARGNLLPSYTGNAGKVLAVNTGATDVEWVASGGSGTVTSVALTVPSGFLVTGSPITAAGTLAITTAINGVVYGNGSGLAAATIGTGLSFSTGTLSNSAPMVYPGAGIAVSTGSGWTTSLTAPSGALVGTTDTQTLTNKTISGANNTLSNIGNASLTNSSVTVNGTAISLGDSGTVTATATNALTIGTGLSGTSYNGSAAVTIAIDSTVATLTGTQTLTNKTLTSPILTLNGSQGTAGQVPVSQGAGLPPVWGAVSSPEIKTPTNVSPTTGATGIGATPTLTGSTYYSLYGVAMAASQWQVSTVSDFASTVVNTGDVAGTAVTYNVGSGVLSTSTTYYWRVRYKDANGVYSDWSTATTFTTAASFGPTTIGEAYGGGYYAGKIVQGGSTYYLIVAPKSSGENSSKQWKTSNDAGPAATQTLNNGPAASSSMNSATYPAAQFCEGLSIGGYTDWYLPARDELELCYRNLKPTTTANSTSARPKSSYTYPEGNDVSGDTMGINRNSDPTGAAYTSGSPAQTSVSAFQTGNSEAFAAGGYWSSSEYSSTSAWRQDFDGGNQTTSNKVNSLYVRAVRRLPV